MMLSNSVQSSCGGVDDRQLVLWQQLLERRTGVRADTLDSDWLVKRIVTLVCELGIAEPMQYYQQLANRPDSDPEWTRFLDTILVRDTRFFRHCESMDAVATIWRDFQTNRCGQSGIAKPGASSSFTAWSVGCSSGEETYSLALVLADNCFDSRNSYGVIGLDISAQAVARARGGIYTSTQLMGLSQRQRDHYFDSRPSGDWIVGEQLRRHTCFVRGNVLQLADSPQLKGADLIYCQNLLPYFRRWQRHQLVANLVACLKPGGHLIVGPGELASWQPPHMQRVPARAVQIYRRGDPASELGVSEEL
ncbi:protein-glutamate O-methyltransferase CheR [bacterium SCSIO 12696]|nr:protein-glutamate O-methyltransferase CheR [bacterium SCSIO 12696]